eukprot:3949702-Prymnesium_polylepis.1
MQRVLTMREHTPEVLLLSRACSGLLRQAGTAREAEQLQILPPQIRQFFGWRGLKGGWRRCRLRWAGCRRRRWPPPE